MPLKDYQARVLKEVREYLAFLAVEKTANSRYAALAAWDNAKQARPTLIGNSQQRKCGLGIDLPDICIKVPTGGGKTLLATQILGEAHRVLLPHRNGTGLVLWVVPSNQIY